jgi:hypothetical protein
MARRHKAFLCWCVLLPLEDRSSSHRNHLRCAHSHRIVLLLIIAVLATHYKGGLSWLWLLYNPTSVFIGVFEVAVLLTLVVGRMSGHHLHSRNIVLIVGGFIVLVRHDDNWLLWIVAIIIFIL